MFHVSLKQERIERLLAQVAEREAKLLAKLEAIENGVESGKHTVI